MYTIPIQSSRARLSVLLIAACFGALQAASGCGRAASRTTIDSETHWLMRCDSDLDCGAGSCECGVCTQTCATSADCSALGVAGVECVPQGGACGVASEGSGGTSAAAPAGSACLLPCDADDDCSALGADAVCDDRRCALPASTGGDGAGGTSNAAGSGGDVSGGAGGQVGIGGAGGTSEAVLCDGSDDVRFVYVAGGGFVDPYYGFAASRGYRFLVIDGQCNFWRATAQGGAVSSGTLTADDAASFASTLGYARLSQLASYEDIFACPDAGTSQIWTPASRFSCVCGCGEEDGAPPGLNDSFALMGDARLDGWLASAAPVTGPARLLLIGFTEMLAEPDPLRWPLTRTPDDFGIYPAADGLPIFDEMSGVELTDPAELSALRAARDTYAERVPGADHTPLAYAPATSNPAWFHMLLRDELPANVQAALVAAQAP